jgi:hypothetical protein
MAMGAEIAGDGSQGSRKESKCRVQESRLQGVCEDEGAQQRLEKARA